MTTLLHSNNGGNNHVAHNPEQLFDPATIRTKLTQSHINTNPILQAASPIINYVAFITTQAHNHKKNTVDGCLCHEIQCFTQKLQPHYRTEVVLAARHILCAWCHELLTHSTWGKKRRWTTPSTPQQSPHTSWDGENFFEIIRRSAQQPTEYSDLLQLCYYCMTLGYQGIYRAEEHGYLACYTIIDKLWALIGQNMQTPNHLAKLDTVIQQPPWVLKIRYGLLTLTILCVISCAWFEYQHYQNMQSVLRALHIHNTPHTR